MSERSTDIAYRWSPIKSLYAIDCDYDFSEIDSLQRQWLSIKERREASNPDSYKAFLERLDRSWSIETGIIEGLYTLDMGVTKTLVQRGFNAEWIDQNATNRDPEELVRILEDHQQAAEAVYHYIREGRPLSKYLIRSLHVTLTQHQPTYTAYDQFGNRFETALDRGGFKKLPNNPTRSDGSGIHEYCPPVQVDSEIDNLVEWHGKHRSENYHPLLIAAWLHHAFSQIHPFQDGNGRVARALLTWHLVRENYLSVVVSRDGRAAYIDALEKADYGNPDAFVDFLVQLEKQCILEALNEPEQIPGLGNIEQVIDRIVEQVQELRSKMRLVNDVAQILLNVAIQDLESWVDRICHPLNESGFALESKILRGGPGERERWYEADSAKMAELAGHQANLNESRFFVKLLINPESSAIVPSFAFFISIHHVGRQLTGVMAATASSEVYDSRDPDIDESKSRFQLDYRGFSSNSFLFTWQDDAEVVTPRFAAWVEEELKLALRDWSGHISG